MPRGSSLRFSIVVVGLVAVVSGAALRVVPSLLGDGGRPSTDPIAASAEGLSPQASDAELRRAAEGNTTFAFRLYKELSTESGNLLFSPCSITVALATAYAGARGQTARQMAQALDFTLPQDRLHTALGALDSAINSRSNPEQGVQLSIANAAWVQRGLPLLDTYTGVLSTHYGMVPQALDFITAPEESRVTINDWVSEKTNQKIRDLLPQGSVHVLTRLVLTNAVYFLGPWAEKFDASNTRSEPFHLLDGTSVDAPMMRLEGHGESELNYAEGTLRGVPYQAVELPYEGDELSMLILLPEIRGFRDFERELNPSELSSIQRSLRPATIDLFIPKFTFESEFPLRGALMALGMRDAFSPSADFSGITRAQRLAVDEVYHKAFIAVSEEGTEAAAATGVVMILVSPRLAFPTFCVDHPFLFFILDRQTGTILFMGRVLDPTK